MRWRLDPGQIEVVDEDVAAVLRQMTPAERLAIAADANRIGREMLADGVRLRQPGWTDEQVRREVVRVMLDGAIDPQVARAASEAAMARASSAEPPPGNEESR